MHLLLLRVQALIAAGLYTPLPEQPGFSFWQRTKGKKAAAAAN
jgi:hypothetical protein